MSSSDLATTMLLASAARVCGRFVSTVRPPRACLARSEETAAPTRRPSGPAWPELIRPVPTVISHDASLTPSPPRPSALGLTSIGP